MTAELGTTSDPTALVPGNTETVGSIVWWLQYYGNTLSAAGDGLARIDTADGWRGDAANAFRAAFSNQPGTWTDAGNAFHEAASSFDAYATALATGQAQAAQAIELWNGGQTEAAQAMLAQARATVGRAGENAANAVAAATARAPQRPGFWSKVGAGLDGLGRGLLHLGSDVVDDLASVGNAVVHHPDDLGWMAAGLGLTVLSAGGEIGGFALDATVVGGVIGVPANVVSTAGIVTGAGMMMEAGADLGRHATGDDAVHSGDSADDAPAQPDGPGPNSTSSKSRIANRLGVSTQDLEDAIHELKDEANPSGARRNPDVIVDLDTGEVYVKLPNGKPGSDSIGNIRDYLPGD
jgi:hypothetical protein